jgi:ATP synthase protein I
MPNPEIPMRALGTIGSVGFAFVIAVVLGWWFGSTLDRWLGSSPWLTFIFFFLGVIAGGLNVFRTFGALSTRGKDDGRA